MRSMVNILKSLLIPYSFLQNVDFDDDEDDFNMDDGGDGIYLLAMAL